MPRPRCVQNLAQQAKREEGTRGHSMGNYSHAPSPPEFLSATRTVCHRCGRTVYVYHRSTAYGTDEGVVQRAGPERCLYGGTRSRYDLMASDIAEEAGIPVAVDGESCLTAVLPDGRKVRVTLDGADIVGHAFWTTAFIAGMRFCRKIRRFGDPGLNLSPEPNQRLIDL